MKFKRVLMTLVVALLVVCSGFVLTACDDSETKADVVVNNVKETTATMQTVYKDANGDFVIALRSKFIHNDEELTVNQLLAIYFDQSYGADFNSATNSVTLSYGDWPDITTVTLANSSTNQWVIRNSSNQIVTDENAAVANNAVYYYSYEAITNPEAFVIANLVAPASADDKFFYYNRVSTKTVELVVKAKKAGGTDEVLFSGTIDYTAETVTFEKVLKAALDSKGILYSITGGFINSIGSYSNGMDGYGDGAYPYFHSGHIYNGEFMTNYSGAHQVIVGDGAKLEVYFY